MITIRKYIPIDIFSKRRFIYNLFLYCSYSILFSICFIISIKSVSELSTRLFSSYSYLITTLFIIITVKFFVFNFFNFKRISLKTFSLYDIYKISVLVFLASVLLISLHFFINILSEIPLRVFVLDGILTLISVLAFRSIFIYARQRILPNTRGKSRTLIIGAGETGEILLQSLCNSEKSSHSVVGFVDDDPKIIGMRIQSKKIYGPIENLITIAKISRAEKVIIAMPFVPAKKIKQIVELLDGSNITISKMPSYIGIVNGNVKVDYIREIKIEDLLTRSPLQIDTKVIAELITDKKILVTGAAGSIGSEICRQVLQFKPKTLIALDRAETPLFFLEKELNDSKKYNQFISVIADITNEKRIYSLFERYHPEIVFHAAAYKHVPMMEANFEESLVNNVLGTKNVVDNANSFGTEKFIMVSTDKAVNPSSIMGLTKRIAEIYTHSLNQVSRTQYTIVRFGNVLDSSGNVTQIFKEQISKGGPVTVTHPEMKRYFMLTSEAVQLVLQAGTLGSDGKILLLNMGEPVKILDFAKTMIKLSGLEVNKDIEIKFTGVRPGEKLFEELSYNDESICSTPHPKIFACKSNGHRMKHINRQIKQLLDNVHNPKKLQIIVKRIVPEYKNGC